MKQYKTVAGPAALTIDKNGSFTGAVAQYASIIEQEAKDGWVLDFIQEVPVQKNNGCLAGLLASFGIGAAYETVTFNMLVFSRDV